MGGKGFLKRPAEGDEEDRGKGKAGSDAGQGRWVSVRRQRDRRSRSPPSVKFPTKMDYIELPRERGKREGH